ncbi:MAG: alpha-L-fucosidase [Clostridia bacterium]|nr:alpha-L-fucosidase [Clostridia bacterium]
MTNFLKEAARVTPSRRQLDWFDTEFYAFVHFTVNTYTDLEWGLGNEDEAIFNPYDLNCDEWVEAVKSAGMKGLILTAKHHDGFCLWQTNTTMHSVRSSPWKNGQGDVVRECAEACRRGGIKFGVYLSPWDRNAPSYGSDAYNDFYCAQLTELLTNYGELFMVWFDGACGEGPNGRKQNYDFERYISLIRRYQPNAVIFNDHGPDVRWCGNEAGRPRRAEWSVVPSELCYRAEVQTAPSPMAGDLSFLYNTDENVGDLFQIMHSKGLVFTGAEIDMSIRPGWFWHEKEEPHSLDRLWNTYLSSCGGNTSFNLNVPPMPSGRIDPRDIVRLRELGEKIENSVGEKKKVPCRVEKIWAEGGQAKYDIILDRPADIRYVSLMEDLTAGQRIESFRLLNGGVIYNGYTVGHHRICPVNTSGDRITLFITGARDEAVLRDVSVYEA